jgi:toxin ParE1/3/4
MAKRLVQRRAAEEDVAERVAYVAADRPTVAHRYAIAVENAYERIRSMPEIGMLRSYGPRALRAVRVWPVPGFRRFLVFYRVTEKTVEVL